MLIHQLQGTQFHILLEFISMSKPLGVNWTSQTCGTWVHKRGINCDYELQEWRKKDDSDVVIGINYGIVASSSSWFKVICSHVTSSRRIRGPLTIIAFFWRWTPWSGADKQVNTYLPRGQAPKFFIWLVENTQFTQIPSIWLGGS
jgi:hypothetical protein